MTGLAKGPSPSDIGSPSAKRDAAVDSVRIAYDSKYSDSNFFLYRKWLYRSYVKALAKRAGLERGSMVLDAGCGQGFFTALLGDLGFAATGVDLSSVGIESARREYERENVRFFVGDVLDLPYRDQFDAVFIRSCSLYNVDDLYGCRDVTSRLLEYVRPGGVLVFDYYSRLAKSDARQEWRYHNLNDLKRHFEDFNGTKHFFSLRFDSILLGVWSFSGIVSRINEMVSRYSGVGGELVAIVQKEEQADEG